MISNARFVATKMNLSPTCTFISIFHCIWKRLVISNIGYYTNWYMPYSMSDQLTKWDCARNYFMGHFRRNRVNVILCIWMVHLAFQERNGVQTGKFSSSETVLNHFPVVLNQKTSVSRYRWVTWCAKRFPTLSFHAQWEPRT